MSFVECGTKRNAEELSLFANLHVYFLFPREYDKRRFFIVDSYYGFLKSFQCLHITQVPIK